MFIEYCKNPDTCKEPIHYFGSSDARVWHPHKYQWKVHHVHTGNSPITCGSKDEIKLGITASNNWSDVNCLECHKVISGTDSKTANRDLAAHL